MIPTPDSFASAAEALARARVPFHHHGRTRAGADCIGIALLAAWECGLDVHDFLAYERTPDQAVLLAAVAKHCVPEPWTCWRERGRLVVMRQQDSGPARHFAVSLGAGRIMHMRGHARVMQVEPRHEELVDSVWLFRGLA